MNKLETNLNMPTINGTPQEYSNHIINALKLALPDEVIKQPGKAALSEKAQRLSELLKKRLELLWRLQLRFAYAGF